MKIIHFCPKTIPVSPKNRGYSLLELLIVLAAMSSVAAMGYVHFPSTTEAVKAAKLRQDVAALNMAVRTYLMSGGDLSRVADGTAVIAKLKTTASAAHRPTLAGLRGSMVDQRLRAVGNPGEDSPRAVWNNAIKSFVVQNNGSGFREFVLDAAVPTTPTEESRSAVMAMNSADKWIWSFQDQAAAAAAPRGGVTPEETPVIAASPASIMIVLQAPEFSKPGALYEFSAFNPDLKVSLVDPNAADTAAIFYSISNGPWQQWNGTPLSLPRAFTTELRAYSTPLDPDRYEESAIASAAYETIFFGGSSSGFFSDPKGDSGLTSNLLNGRSGPFFTWGSPASGFTNPNSLTISGKSFTNVAPDQLFELATLSYYNGSTYAGTNATSVKLNIILNLTTPAIVETLPFTFSLLSTPNKNKDADVDADYVYIPSVSTKFNAVIKGQVFYLVLSFGSNNSNGFSTIDEFHTHENKTMTGSIFGRFTTTPPLP